MSKNLHDTIDTTNPKPKRYAILSAPLNIANIELNCSVLDDETRVLTATSVFAAFGRPRRANSRLEVDGIKIPAFMDAKNLETYINQGIIDRITVVTYLDGKTIKKGYNAEILVDMCEIYLKARRDGVLTESQQKLAIQAEILQSAFARVGITAIIDEATGYQKVRTNDALRLLLSRYIAEGLRNWIKTFHDSFFEQLDRLYGNEKTNSKNRPQYYGKFINKYIYEPLENGYIKAALDKLNIRDDKTRKARFHQWLTNDGRDSLIRQIARVEARMEMHPNIEKFQQMEKHQKTISIAPYLFDEMNRIIE